jgi:excinuclease UvrABC nuclease subunit
MLAEHAEFDVHTARESLRAVPECAGIFALFGADAGSEPYVGRTPNLRRRMARLLQPQPTQTRRLELAGRVRRIEWQRTGSDFEQNLLLYRAMLPVFGERTLKRLHLRAPHFVRMAGTNAYPRIYVTNRISQRSAEWFFGPFPSRAAAERYTEELLNLFLLRRCHEDLEPYPEHPGCVYSEMKMCLAPCFKGCSDERYAEESAAVRGFLATRGASLIRALETERAAASAALEFERAANAHKRLQKAETVSALASELVHPLSELRALILQPSAEVGCVDVFLLERGVLSGPERYSTMGMRLANEQSGSTSLFAQPMAVEAVPLEEPGTIVTRDALVERLMAVVGALNSTIAAGVGADLTPSLALVNRWYARPATKRAGEIFFPGEDASWPAKAVVRGISRVAAGALVLPSISQ